MTHAIGAENKQLNKLKQFQEFIFIGKSSSKLASPSEQLHLLPNSTLLSQAAIEECLLIAQIHTDKDVTKQLESLEIKPGAKVDLISKTSNGSIVVCLNKRLIGIGAEIARKIIAIANN